MVRRDGAEIRKERIHEISKRVQALLHNSGGKIPLGKTLSILAFEFDLTKEKIMEYLKILEDLGRFVLDIERNRIRKVTEEEKTSNE